MSLHNVTPGAKAPHEFNVIIEIPMNADPIKYEVDKVSGALFVDRSEEHTLNSCGALAPGVTLCRLMGWLADRGKPAFYEARLPRPDTAIGFAKPQENTVGPGRSAHLHSTGYPGPGCQGSARAAKPKRATFFQ